MRCGYSRLLLVVRPGGRPPSTRQTEKQNTDTWAYRMAYRLQNGQQNGLQNTDTWAYGSPTDWEVPQKSPRSPTDWEVPQKSPRSPPDWEVLGVKKLSEESGLRNPSNQLM